MSWAVCIGLLLGSIMTGCESTEEPTDRARERVRRTAPPPSSPSKSRTRTLPVIADFAVRAAYPDARLANVRSPSLAVGRRSAAVVAIRRPAFSARCLTAARFRLYVKRVEGPSNELAVYPSHVFDAATKRDGDRFGFSGTALDVRPRAIAKFVAGSWAEWDVTRIFRLWIGSRAFPSRGILPPERGPVVLTLRDVDGAAPFAMATILTQESPSNSPYVIVTRRASC